MLLQVTQILTENSDEKIGDKQVILGDSRIMRPRILQLKESKKSLLLQQKDLFKINGFEINFFTPNNISIFVNIAHKERLKAKKIHEKIFSKKKKIKK